MKSNSQSGLKVCNVHTQILPSSVSNHWKIHVFHYFSTCPFLPPKQYEWLDYSICSCCKSQSIFWEETRTLWDCFQAGLALTKFSSYCCCGQFFIFSHWRMVKPIGTGLEQSSFIFLTDRERSSISTSKCRGKLDHLSGRVPEHAAFGNVQPLAAFSLQSTISAMMPESSQQVRSIPLFKTRNPSWTGSYYKQRSYSDLLCMTVWQVRAVKWYS